MTVLEFLVYFSDYSKATDFLSQAVTPFRNPVANQCVDYQEPPLVDMDDRVSS